jgi:hypothetical protein
MPQRLAGTMSLVAFAFCLVVGGFGANNALSTVIYRALVAMVGTFMVALIIGVMASKMIEENVAETVKAAETAREPENFTGISEAKQNRADR